MRIGEVAKQTGCRVQTLRFYEAQGLLPAPERSASGYRLYGHEHVERLNFIRHCRSLDMPLDEIRRLLALRHAPSGAACANANRLLDNHIDKVEQQIAALGQLKQQLLALRQTCDSDSRSECGILQTLTAAAEGEHCACHSR